MPTNFSDYFTSKLDQEYQRNIQQGISPKFDQLQTATDAKIKLLESGIVQAKQRELAAANSWVGQAGLDPNGVAGTLLNLAASGYSDASRVAGDVTSLLAGDLEAMWQDANTSELERASIDKYRQGVATPEDMERINRRHRTAFGESPSPLERADAANAARERSDAISQAFDRKHLIHQGRRDQFREDLGEGFDDTWNQVKQGASALWSGEGQGRAAGAKDMASGLAQLVFQAGEAAAGNKIAALEYITENIPQLALGAAGKGGQVALALSNAGYASENYQQGIAKYQAENNGAYPPENVRQSMAMHAASLALAEQVGDVSLLKGMSTAKDAAGNAIRTGFKQSLLNTGKAAAKGVVTEAATEGWQTYAEGEAQLKPASARDIYEGAVIGGVAGGGLSGGGRALAEITKSTPEHIEQARREHASTKARNEAQDAAIVSGDVSALVDPKSAVYAPDRAVAALAGHVSQDTVSDEVRQTKLQEAGQIVADLETRHEQLTALVEQNSPEGVAANKAALVKAQEQGKTQLAELLEKSIEIAETQTPEVRQAREAELEQLAETLGRARENLDRFTTGLATREINNAEGAVDVPALVEQISAPVQETDTAGVEARTRKVDAVFNLSMKAPESLAPEQAKALATNQSNGLTQAQRTYFQSFAEARTEVERLRKGMDQVSQEILVGGKGFIGLAEHRARIGSAIASGNQALTTKYMATLQAFAQDQKAKAVAITQAWNGGAGKGAQIEKVDGRWQVVTGGRRTDAQLKANKGLTLNSPVLVESIQAGARAVITTARELKAAQALRFNTEAAQVAPATVAAAQTQTNAGSTDVTDVPQAHDATKNAAGRAQAAQAASDPQASAAVGTSNGSGVRRDAGQRAGVASVEPAGVAQNTEAAEKKKEPAQKTEETQVTEEAAQSSTSQVQKTAEDAEGSTQSNDSPTVEDASTGSDESPSPQESPEGTSESSTQDTEEAEVAHEDAEKVTVEGRLGVFNVESPTQEGEAIDALNPLAQGMTQDPGKRSDDTLRPLVMVKDFLSSLLERAGEFLPKGMELSEVQQHTLESFVNHAKAWAKTIRANMPKVADPRFRDADLMQFLLDGNGQVDENLVTAIAVAGYDWVAANAGNPRFMTMKAVNALLERDEDARLSYDIYERLAPVGVYQHVLADSMGGAVLDALGIKDRKSAPQNHLARLRAAMGMHVIKLLEDRGLITRTTIYGDEMAKLRGRKIQPGDIQPGSTPGNPKYVPHHFLAIARDWDVDEGREPVAGVRKIRDAVRESQGILSKLFKVASGKKTPRLKPSRHVPENTKGSDMLVPKHLEKVLKKNQASPRVVRQDLLTLLDQFSEDEQLEMMGVVPEENHLTHVVNRRAVEAKNDALRREWTDFREFVGEYLATSEQGLATPFFYEFMPWKQQRVGLATNVANPQTSKIARHLVMSPEWEVTIDSNDQELMTSFWLRVGEGLKIKTERQDNALSVIDVQARLAEPVYDAAVQALRKNVVREEALSQEEKAAILKAVAKGKERLHTLSALTAVAYQQEAQAQAAKDGGEGNYSFPSQLMGEVDGVANGTMLNHVLLGVGTDALLEQGGFYHQGSGHTQYNQYRGTAGNQDIYESTGRVLHEVMGDLMQTEFDSDHQKIADGIWDITGTIFNEETGTTSEGRDLIKGALNPLAFGSGMQAIMNNMADAFLAQVYAGFEQLSKDGASQEQVDAYVTKINRILAASKADLLALGHSIEVHMENPLPHSAEKALHQGYIDTVGKGIRTTIEREFGEFIAARNQLNAAANATFHLAQAVYDGTREAYVADLRAKGLLKLDDKGNPLEDLSQEQEAELRTLLQFVSPIVRTPMSDERRTSGLLMAKQGRKQRRTPEYVNKTAFGTPLSTGKKSVALYGFGPIQMEPGTRMGSAQTHSTDSATSHDVQAEMDVLNVHDAVGTGVHLLGNAARLMNKSLFTRLMDYSPLQAQYQAMVDVVMGIERMHKAGVLSSEARERIQEFLKAYRPMGQKKPGVSLEALLTTIKYQAATADHTKFTRAAQWVSVDQYAYQGGNYEVTDKGRDEMAKRAKEVQFEITPAVEAAARLIDNGWKEAAPTVSRQSPSTPESTPRNTPQNTPFGRTGQPTKLDTPLVAFFDQNPTPTLKETMTALGRAIQAKGDGRVNQFQLHLLRQLYKSIPGHVTVKLVTPDTKPEDVLDMPKGASFGWIASKAGKTQIHILSKEFVNSGLHSTETLLHELVHATVAHLVANPTAETQPLIDELVRLQEKAQEYVSEAELEGFEEPLNNLQEFIAWGMTNPRFQREVLNQITTQPRTKKTALVKGMKAFIDTLVGILFHGSTKSAQKIAVTGMTILINNVSGLIQQANQDRLQYGPFNLSHAVSKFNTQDIHNALNGDGLSAEFDTKLSQLLRGIVHTLYGPWGSYRADVLQKTQSAAITTAEDVWLHAQASGKAPFALSVQASPIAATERELHAMEHVEATMRAALDSKEASMRMAYKQLNDLYFEMRSKIQPSDFKDPAEYDFIFNMGPDASGDRRSHHLARFAAFALAHEGFNKLMQQDTDVLHKDAPAKSWSERIQRVFERILAFIAEKRLHTYQGQRADHKLEILVQHLVQLEAKKKLSIIRAEMSRGKTLGDAVERKAEQAVGMVKAGAHKLASMRVIKDNKNAFIRAGATMTRLYANDQVDSLVRHLEKMRDKHFPALRGEVTDLLKQVTGHGKVVNLLQLMSTKVQRHRKQVITQITKAAVAAYAQKLNRQQKAAVSQVFLRTGMHVLLDSMNMRQLEQLLSQPQFLKQAMDGVETQLRNTGLHVGYVEHFMNQANALAWFKVTGEAKHASMMLNAHNIVRLYGTTHKGRLTEAQSQAAQPLVEQLVALYALAYTSQFERNQALAILHTENRRDEGDKGNGVEFTLRLARRLETEARDRLFKGEEALMMHGYTPEIYNPGTMVAVADEAGGKELEYQGYTLVGPVEIDPADPDKEARNMYVLKDGGLARFQTGVLSYSGKRAKGSRKHSGYLNIRTGDGAENASKNADIAHAKPGGLSRGPRPDLSKVGGTYMVPVLNPHGEIVNWRYLMKDRNKDALLERNNSFDDVLGVLAGSIYDKESTTQTNKQALKALQEIYKAEEHRNPEAFVRVGPYSKDPALQELWSMLPDDTQTVARSLFGQDGIMVKRELLLPMFGFRQHSLADAFHKDPVARGHAERVFVELIERLLGVVNRVNARRKGITLSVEESRKMAHRIAVTITRFEKGWQEIVHEIKDIIVVKSVTVMVDNVLSNWSYLMLSGVPIRTILKDHLVAMRGARAYEEDTEALEQLQIKVATGMAPANAQQEIARLEDALARNPVHELVEAGLMSSIVEDVAADDATNPYSYKSLLTRKAEAVTDKLPRMLVETGKFFYMAHDTKLYQGLSRFTRMSDFLARYTLYQHLMNQKDKEGKAPDQEDVLHEVSEAFVNYDTPLPKSLQYLDHMGIMPFTKYYLRIQRVLMKLVAKNPAKVLATLLLDNFVNLGPIVLDSAWVHRIGNNPLEWGALQLPGTVDELGTIAAATAVVK